MNNLPPSIADVIGRFALSFISGGDVAEESLLLVGLHEAEQIARLGVVALTVAVIVAIGIAGNPQRRFSERLSGDQLMPDTMFDGLRGDCSTSVK